MTRPSGGRVAVGQRVSSTTTMSPDVARRALPGRHLHVGEDAAIERHDKADRRTSSTRSGRRASLLRALEDPDDAALGAIAALVLDARDDTIAVQRFLDVRRRDVEVAARRPPSATTKP